MMEEWDAGSSLSMDITDPSLATLMAIFRGLYDSLRKKGIVDLYLGRRLRGIVEGLGYVDVGQEGWTCINHGEDPLLRGTERSLSTMVSAGLLPREQFDIQLRASRDPTFYGLGLTLFSAWGRKPVQATLMSRGEE
jgi:hypothetical protein